MSSFLKLFDSLPKTLGELRQSFRTEQNQDDRQNQNNFATAEIEETKHCVHR